MIAGGAALPAYVWELSFRSFFPACSYHSLNGIRYACTYQTFIPSIPHDRRLRVEAALKVPAAARLHHRESETVAGDWHRR